MKGQEGERANGEDPGSQEPWVPSWKTKREALNTPLNLMAFRLSYHLRDEKSTCCPPHKGLKGTGSKSMESTLNSSEEAFTEAQSRASKDTLIPSWDINDV